MNTTKINILKEIAEIAEDCYWSSGCSDECVLKDMLKEANERLEKVYSMVDALETNPTSEE